MSLHEFYRIRPVLELGVSPLTRRLAAVRELAESGALVDALVAPIIPGLTDREVSAILAAATEEVAASAVPPESVK